MKPLGPVQLYVAPPINDAVKLKFVPSHTAELLDTVGDVGMGLTTTVVVTGTLVHWPVVTVTEYVPAFAAVMLVRTGFC